MSSLARDLIRWEKGELTLEQVESAHPEAGVRELMRLHTRLSMLRAIPLPDVEKAWSMTLPALEGGSTQRTAAAPPRSSRLRDWARRPLAASFAALFMSGGAAYAAGVEPVQRAVDGVLDRARNVTGLGGTGDGAQETTSAAPSDASDESSNEGDDATARGRERADEVRGQGKKDGPNHGRRDFGHSHKKDKDNEGDRGKDRAPGLTGEDPGTGSPPAHPANDDSKKPDKEKERAPGPPAAPVNNGNGGNGGVHGTPGDNGNGSDKETGPPTDKPDAGADQGGGAPPAPSTDGPGASGETHGKGNGQTKDKTKP